MRLNQLVLVVAKSPEEYTGAKQIEMPEAGGSIGRNPSCTLSLVDHNRFISGTHCLISVYGETNYISDVSTNGILINGNKVLRNQPVSLYDGDVISLGQYELHVMYEHVSVAQDIAADIAPERDSSDPLVNLGAPVVEEEQQVGTLEDLFMETKPDEIDGDDPVTHLNFSMQRDDDYLIQDEVPKPKHAPEPPENKRQLVDDSFSIDSEFDIPNLIPEDWLGVTEMKTAPVHNDVMPQTPVSRASATVTDNTSSAPVTPSSKPALEPSQPSAADIPSPSAEPILQTAQPSQVNQQNWEEVTQPFEPFKQQEPSATQESNSEVNFDDSSAVLSAPAASDQSLSDAFYQGLGINAQELVSSDEHFFRQMGACLRLCMESLQKELNDVETMKQDGESTPTATPNLTELMLTLNSQKLLSPQELIEQMLDELHDHRVLYERAVSHFVVDQINACEPKRFEHDFGQSTKFATKSKLWSAYTAHYDENRLKFNDNSVKKLIKENYEKIVQEKHA